MIPNDVEEILSTKTGLKRYIFLFVMFIIFAFILFVSYYSALTGAALAVQHDPCCGLMGSWQLRPRLIRCFGPAIH